MMPVLLLAAVIACLAGPSAAFHDLQEQLIPPVVPDTDWRSLMQLPIDLQELAAAASLEAGSYGYGGTKEYPYGYSSSDSNGAADAAAGWRRMLLQQADAAFAPLLQPGSYSGSSSTATAGSYGNRAAALAQAAAAGSYGEATSDEGFGYASMRKLLQQIDDTAGSYGRADAVPAGSYGDAAAVTAEGLSPGIRRLLQDSTGAAAGSYGDAAATTDEGLYGGTRRLLQDSTGATGTYRNAAAATDDGLYGGMRRLLQDSATAAGSPGGAAALTESSRSSDSHVVLGVDVPDTFNPENNTLALSFSGAWTHIASSSFSAAFRLELLDASGTEVLTFESPTLHHRTLNRHHHQQQQQHTPILLNYTTLFSDVQLVPGEQARLRLTTQDSSFQGFQASIRLFWQQQQQQDEPDSPPVFESATPGAYGESEAPGEYSADAAAAAAAADALDTILPEAPEILSREQLPYNPPTPVSTTSSSSSSGSSDDTIAPAPIMDPTDPAAPLNIMEAPVGLLDPPAPSDAAGMVPAGPDSIVTNVPVTQPVVAPDEVVPSALAAAEVVVPSVTADVPADAVAVPTAADAYAEAPTAAAAAAAAEALTAAVSNGPAAAQDAPSAATPLDVPAAVVELPPAAADANTKPKPAAAAAAALQRGWAKPGHLRGPHTPDEAATAATGPAIDWQTQQQSADAQTLPVTPAMPPVGLAEGQLLQPMVAAAVPLPSDAFAGSFSNATTDSTGVTTAADFGCRRKIPRGLQCGGTGGHCAEVTSVLGSEGGSSCKDEPFVDACCASGTVCARKSEAVWVCAHGHGFLRRMLA